MLKIFRFPAQKKTIHLFSSGSSDSVHDQVCNNTTFLTCSETITVRALEQSDQFCKEIMDDYHLIIVGTICS